MALEKGNKCKISCLCYLFILIGVLEASSVVFKSISWRSFRGFNEKNLVSNKILVNKNLYSGPDTGSSD